MKIIENSVIPFGHFLAINLFGFLFVKKGKMDKVSDKVINHESIHSAQMKEMLWLFFYLWYVIEWFIRLFQKGDAYRSISFEREAYDNEKDMEYLKNRKHYAWFKSVKLKNLKDVKKASGTR